MVTPNVTQVPRLKNDVTPDKYRGSDSYKAMNDTRVEVQRYLRTLQNVYLRRIYYIMTDGMIVEMDLNNFFRNKKFITDPVAQLTLRIKDHEYILKLGWLIVDFIHEHETLRVQVWKENVKFLSFPFRVLLTLGEEHLKKKLFEVKLVEGFSFGQPFGETRIMTPYDIETEFLRVNTPKLTHQFFF